MTYTLCLGTLIFIHGSFATHTLFRSNTFSRNSVQFCQWSGLPVIQMTVALGLTLGRGPPTPYRLVKSGNLGVFIAVQRARLVRGMSISKCLALCEGSELGTVTLILESDCMFVFTVLLVLVEGLEVLVALNFDIVIALVLVVIVVIRNRAARKIARGVVLWLIVVGPSTWNVEHVDGADGVDGVRANFWESPLDQVLNYIGRM